MPDRLVQTSKFLSYVLRHNPGVLGLELEPGGWVDVSTLLERAQADGRSIDRSLLERVVERGNKSRFALTANGKKIRAEYGHSTDVDLNLEPVAPPRHLYHGTAEHTLESIRAEGLRPQSRQYVHLSRTRDQAGRVGRRHGAPVILAVRAEKMHEAGHALYRTTDAVWLTQTVPPKYLTRNAS